MKDRAGCPQRAASTQDAFKLIRFCCFQRRAGDSPPYLSVHIHLGNKSVRGTRTPEERFPLPPDDRTFTQST